MWSTSISTLLTEIFWVGEKLSLQPPNISNVAAKITEDILIEEGYKFIGFSGYTKYPLYQKENIYGMFICNSFRLGEGLLTTEEELRKEDKKENQEEISK